MANWPTRLDYKLGEGAAGEIDLFVANAADLEKIVSVAAKQPPKTSFEDILVPISKETGKSFGDLRVIFNTLENMRDIQEDLGSSDVTIARFEAASSEELGKKIRENAEKIKKAIANYGRDNPVTIAIKAQRLTYSRERLLHDSEVITDVRPVFDSAGSKVIEFIVTHTLVLDAIKDNEFHRIFLSLDNADVLNLRKACDRAITKAQTLKESLGKTCPTDVIRDDAI